MVVSLLRGNSDDRATKLFKTATTLHFHCFFSLHSSVSFCSISSIPTPYKLYAVKLRMRSNYDGVIIGPIISTIEGLQ